MNRYIYKGAVMEFNKCVQSSWQGETIANSEKKAKSNLIYQWKKSNNRSPNAKINLPDEVKIVE
jgi:hypothetical protein